VAQSRRKGLNVSERGWEAYWAEERNHAWWERPAPTVVELVESLSPRDSPRVLDLGCGLGRHAVAFAAAGFHVTATDASREAVSHLEEWAGDLGLAVCTRVCDASETGLPAASFDIVLSYNVIYHGYREQFAGAIAHARDLLKPQGLFFFTCPSGEDGKYGAGAQLAPHTFACDTSLVPGDIHYFSSEDDLDELLDGFTTLTRRRHEHYWDNQGERQFSSYWQILAQKR
jgi:tellurite methyltransferase